MRQIQISLVKSWMSLITVVSMVKYMKMGLRSVLIFLDTEVSAYSDIPVRVTVLAAPKTLIY